MMKKCCEIHNYMHTGTHIKQLVKTSASVDCSVGCKYLNKKKYDIGKRVRGEVGKLLSLTIKQSYSINSFKQF